MKNLKIDNLLLEISKTENYQVYTEDDFDDYNAFLDYRTLLAMMLEDIKVINKPLKNSSHILLTKFGNDVINQGGWIKYLESEKQKVEREEQKAVFDFQISKIQAKTKLFPYIVSFLSLIISLFAYFKKEDTVEKRVSKSEIMKVIDSISISNQTKKIDLLYNSKQKGDILKTKK